MPDDVPFWVSYAVLALVQGGMVALPRAGLLPGRWPGALRSRWWALIPVASIVGAIFAIRAVAATANGLTYLALVATPILAALAAGWAMRGRRWYLALIAAPLFALAWAGHAAGVGRIGALMPGAALVGQVTALALIALANVTLGALLARVTPVGWLKLGLLAMCLADVALVTSDYLQAPNVALNAAAPAASLPQLQRIAFGTAFMGYGDLFLAGVLGGILAVEGARQGPIALLTAVLAMLFALLFFAVHELPATVPVAAALGGQRAGAAALARSGRPPAAGRGSRQPAGGRPLAWARPWRSPTCCARCSPRPAPPDTRPRPSRSGARPPGRSPRSPPTRWAPLRPACRARAGGDG